MAEADRWAPVLAQTARGRRRTVRIGLAAAAFAFGLLLGFGGTLYNRALSVHSPEVQFQTLQRRIVAAKLPAAVQQAARNLLDPAGANAVRAQGYQRIGLILEEISNARSLAETSRLQFVKDRISAQELVPLAREAAQENSGEQRAKLALVVLALEEAANL